MTRQSHPKRLVTNWKTNKRQSVKSVPQKATTWDKGTPIHAVKAKAFLLSNNQYYLMRNTYFLSQEAKNCFLVHYWYKLHQCLSTVSTAWGQHVSWFTANVSNITSAEHYIYLTRRSQVLPTYIKGNKITEVATNWKYFYSEDEVECSPKKPITTYQTIWCNNPVDHK
jgi:hypothetical protein